MILLSKEIRKLIKKTCPNAGFIWLTDRDKEPFKDLDELVALLRVCSVVHMKFEKGFDCDDYALVLHAKVINQTKSSKAFGEVFVDMHNGKKEKHEMNIAIVKDVPYLVEPQTNKHWKISDKDNVLLVKM